MIETIVEEYKSSSNEALEWKWELDWMDCFSTVAPVEDQNKNLLPICLLWWKRSEEALDRVSERL